LADAGVPNDKGDISFQSASEDYIVGSDERGMVNLLLPAVAYASASHYVDIFKGLSKDKFYRIVSDGSVAWSRVSAQASCSHYESFYIIDEKGDQQTDEVEANMSGEGRLEIMERNRYTEWALALFDQFFKSDELDKVEYNCHEKRPEKIFVEEGSSVTKGSPLFAYQTAEGLKTYYADIDGKVSSCNFGQFCLKLVKEASWF
jgi:hypothetical protein